MSTEFTTIQPNPGNTAVGLDFAMHINAGPLGSKGGSEPNHIIKVPVDSIVIHKNRQRPVDREAVERLYNDIGLHGLLQPIGVKREETGLSIVYGVHRFLAFKKGWEEAKRLIAERTDKDPEAYRMARIWQMIPAVVYDFDMPADYAALKEISENLIRQSLTTNEIALHRTKYTHLLKKLKLVVTADEKRASVQLGQPKRVDERERHDAAHVKRVTATEKATSDLGVDNRTLQRDHQKVTDIARAVARDRNLTPPERIKVESAPGEVEYTLQLAELGIKEGVVIDKTPPEEVTVRVDITDPEQLLEWFKKRLADASKPMSMKYLRGLYQGLGKLIAEQSAHK